MDGQEPIEIDWEAVQKLIDEYDVGNITAPSLHAKMLEVAFNEGYSLCMADQEEAQANLLIMLSAPSGNA
jgi:hypothetical protein